MTIKQKRPYGWNHATLATDVVNIRGDRYPQGEQVNRRRLMAFDARDRKAGGIDEYTGQRSRDGFAAVVDARFYMGRSASASVVRCVVYINTRDGRYYSGRGSAGGGGYHKESAALDDALASAGVKMASRFGGAGDAAMDHALRAVARAAGYGRLPQTIIG